MVGWLRMKCSESSSSSFSSFLKDGGAQPSEDHNRCIGRISSHHRGVVSKAVSIIIKPIDAFGKRASIEEAAAAAVANNTMNNSYRNESQFATSCSV